VRLSWPLEVLKNRKLPGRHARVSARGHRCAHGADRAAAWLRSRGCGGDQVHLVMRWASEGAPSAPAGRAPFHRGRAGSRWSSTGMLRSCSACRPNAHKGRGR